MRRELVLREEGALIDEDRLFSNMLSSMPLTFNVLGPMALDLGLATAVWRHLLPTFIDSVTAIGFEHAPGRGQAAFLADGTAFDAALQVVTPDGEPAMVYVEVKYSEGMTGPAAAHRPRYDEASRAVALYRDPDSAALRGVALEQFWREHMTAQLAVDLGVTPRAHFVAISPRLNRQVGAALGAYAAELVAPTPTDGDRVGFTALTLEAVVDALAAAGAPTSPRSSGAATSTSGASSRWRSPKPTASRPRRRARARNAARPQRGATPAAAPRATSERRTPPPRRTRERLPGQRRRRAARRRVFASRHRAGGTLMASELLTPAQRAALLANGRATAGGADLDPRPVVKLFTPDASATWLLTELDPDDPDRAFGLCDLGLGFPELGYVSLAELRRCAARWGCRSWPRRTSSRTAPSRPTPPPPRQPSASSPEAHAEVRHTVRTGSKTACGARAPPWAQKRCRSPGSKTGVFRALRRAPAPTPSATSFALSGRPTRRRDRRAPRSLRPDPAHEHVPHRPPPDHHRPHRGRARRRHRPVAPALAGRRRFRPPPQHRLRQALQRHQRPGAVGRGAAPGVPARRLGHLPAVGRGGLPGAEGRQGRPRRLLPRDHGGRGRRRSRSAPTTARRPGSSPAPRRSSTPLRSAAFDSAPAAPVRDPAAPRPDLDAFVARTGAAIQHGGASAYYSVPRDAIQLPPPSAFTGSPTSTATESYYSTLFHELTHWTAPAHRCARDLSGRFGSAAYAMEELVAELGAAFLCADLGVTSAPRPDHAQYLADWLRVLRHDKRAIFTAASQASRAATFVQKAEKPVDHETTVSLVDVSP